MGRQRRTACQNPYAFRPAGRDIPVLMAASGPKAIELAGEIADSVLLLVGYTPGLIGTPEYCAQRLMEMTKVGVTNLYLMPLQIFVRPEQDIHAFRNVVFLRLRAEGYL